VIEYNICPKCGCKEIGQGKQVDAGRMYPIDSILMTFGSNIIADICTECGYIIGMRVEKPNRFK
jgi:predicted nucleic-acid-binding Zn-ribbon protein